MSFQTTRRAVLSSTALALLLTGGITFTVNAQEGGEVTVLDSIVITGRKRDETEARLPMSAVVLTEDEVRASTLDSAAAIARSAPGTNFIDFARFGDGYLTMRGIATIGVAQNPLDSTVGISIDGVPTSLSWLNAPILDLDRVEVLRGPQGTTFGRGAMGGSINVVSKPADGTREFRLDAEGGTDGYGFIRGTAGGWIVPDAVAGRGVVRFENFDGDIPNTVIGGTDGGARIGAARGTLRFTPDDTFTIDVTGGFSRNQRRDPSNILLEVPDFPVSGSDVRPFNQQKVAHGSVTVSKDFDSARFTSTTSYQDIRLKSDNDSTDCLLFSAITGFPCFVFNNPARDYIRNNEHERVFNQELRLNSAEGAPWQWVVGASYFRSDYSFKRDMHADYVPIGNGSNDNDITSQTAAIFADASVPLGERWEVSGGLRLAHDRQELNARYTSNGTLGLIPAFSQDDSVSDTYLTGRLALSYRWTEDIMTYASVGRGYASGGFQKSTDYAPLGVAALPFDPATSWTYEVGVKAQVTDDLRFNANVFYNDVKDGQLSFFNPSTLTLYYANQDYRSYGVEAGVTATLPNGLELTGGFAAIQSELVNVSAGSAAAGAIEGNKVPQIPSFSANLGINYRVDAESIGIPGEFTASASYQFVGTRYTDFTNTGKMDAYHIVNARLGWERGNISVYAFANNLLDERPVHYAAPVQPGATVAYVGRGRIVGLGTSIKW
ncbi:TonB-dependent receptor [Shinella sp. BYT-45]|uniref:TonB-dependent receptor n=1 Tax=Shinella sp. BYT-45 TaxID=3377377 RepID=UPI00398107A3